MYVNSQGTLFAQVGKKYLGTFQKAVAVAVVKFLSKSQSQQVTLKDLANMSTHQGSKHKSFQRFRVQKYIFEEWLPADLVSSRAHGVIAQA